MGRQKKSTPEGQVLQAVMEYLQLCRLGKVTRANVGVARMGEKTSNHPWAKDTRRFVRFGTTGESDLRVELDGDPRVIFIETKAPNWKAPNPPKPGASVSTLKKYRHHRDQLSFLAAQNARGNIAFFARSVEEVFLALTMAGFDGLPTPGGVQKIRKTPGLTTDTPKSNVGQK